MFSETKKQNKKIILAAIFVVVLLLGLGFLGINDIHAAEDIGECWHNDRGYTNEELAVNITENECQVVCNNNNVPNGYCEFKINGTSSWLEPSIDGSNASKNVPTDPDNDKFCSGLSFKPKTWFNCLLLWILKLLGILLSMAETLFTWIADADRVKDILDNKAIYAGWSILRDILNVAFIMFLIFSAFATIFQVEKYSYKKTLLTLVIMALLVNFSYPITRFLIDFANVLTYSVFRDLGIGGGTLTTLANDSYMHEIVKGGSTQDDTTYLLASVVFVFIFTVTILVVAILFLVRTVALAFLTVFSSLAFVSTGVPGPGFAENAKKWWSALFQNAFWPATMILVLHIIVTFMGYIKELGMGKMDIIASATSPRDADFIAAVSFYAIPIVFLWFGLGLAQTLGAVGASAVVGGGQKFLGWAGKTLTGYRAAKFGVKAGIKKTERDLLAPIGLSPRSFIAAWKENTEKAEEEKLRPAAGAWRDRLNKSIFFGRKKTNYKQLELDRLKDKERKEFIEVSEESDFVNSNIAGNIGKKGNLDKARLKALFTMLVNQNDQDELMGFIQDNIDNEELTSDGRTFREILDIGEDQYLKNEEGEYINPEGEVVDEANRVRDYGAMGISVSDENFMNSVIKIMKESKTDEKELDKFLLDLSSLAAAKGGIGFGAVRYNPKEKRFVRTNIEQGEMSQANAKKILTMGEAQNIPKTMHRNHFTDQSGHLNQTGKELLYRYASPTAIKHIERHKPDFYKQVGGNDRIAAQMFQFARDLQNDEKGVMLFDSKTKKKQPRVDKKQAKNAMAWAAALRLKAGADPKSVKSEVERGNEFSWKEIREVMEDAGFSFKNKELGKPSSSSSDEDSKPGSEPGARAGFV